MEEPPGGGDSFADLYGLGSSGGTLEVGGTGTGCC